jgi:flagellar assembly protein FliH
LFRIDKSLIENMNLNKEFVVVIPKAEQLDTKRAPSVQPEAPPLTEQDILHRASAQAERIVADAQNSAVEIRQGAWQEGYREGREEAQRELDALISAQAQDAKRVFKRLEAYGQDLRQQLLDSVLGLSFSIAEKIINEELKKDDTVYVGIAKRAIQALNASSKFALHVSRSEYERFFKAGAQWMQEDIGCAPFTVICDPAMEEGGCLVESEEGVVDASVNGQMDKLRRILEGRTEPDEAL